MSDDEVILSSEEAERLRRGAFVCEEPNDKFEPPKELTSHNVVYWSDHWKKLVVQGGESAKGAKAKKFIENNCIEYIKKELSESGKGYYICKPIPDYNKTTHKMNSLPGGEFDCSCQENQTYHRVCSHILALFLQLKIWNHNKKNLNIGVDTV